MEYLHLYLILKSNLQRYLRNIYRALLRLLFLNIVPNVVLTKEPILHPSDSLAHLIIKHLVVVKVNDIKLHDVFLHLIKQKLVFLDPEYEARPLQFPIYYQFPKLPKRRFYLVIQPDDP